MGKKKHVIAMLLAICLALSMMPLNQVEEYDASEKVGSELLELLGVTYEELIMGDFLDSGETYSCIIWLQDVEIEEAVETGIDAAERTREDYSVWSRYDYPYITYKAEGLTYVDVELDEAESDEYVQTYIEAEREAARELYGSSNNSFVAENFMARDTSVTYVSQYSPCVFANLSVSKIVELIGKDEVKYIGNCYGGITELGTTELQIPLTELQESVEVVRADEATDVYNVTGSGVKIGQMELYCPNVSNVNKHGEYCVTSEHATTVYEIMHTVAPDATYYATGLLGENEIGVPKSRLAEQIEWLLSQGVNIINMSATTSEQLWLDRYTDFTRWIDHIAYNHDVHFVQASGNNMLECDDYGDPTYNGVVEPGMAYNIITVGNTYRTEEYNYDIYPTSSYYTIGLLTYKPDIVAPGTYSTSSGTSYSTPLVSGAIALMCDYRPALKTKQHIVKAILAATTSKTMHRYVTTDDEFKIYGAGMLDVRSALYALYVGDYINYTGELVAVGSTRSYSMNVTESDTCMRVALAYANKIEFDTDNGDHLINETPAGKIATVELHIYSPSGAYVTGLTSENANLKVLEFDPRNYGTGTYTIKVILKTAASNGEVTNFGVAWR
ncbi:MAG: S8/S53 family peptidase [Agathobacter sp.]|nr:S8/S53 family peptidase [Agathobacter sp.]